MPFHTRFRDIAGTQMDTSICAVSDVQIIHRHEDTRCFVKGLIRECDWFGVCQLGRLFPASDIARVARPAGDPFLVRRICEPSGTRIPEQSVRPRINMYVETIRLHISRVHLCTEVPAFFGIHRSQEDDDGGRRGIGVREIDLMSDLAQRRRAAGVSSIKSAALEVLVIGGDLEPRDASRVVHRVRPRLQIDCAARRGHLLNKRPDAEIGSVADIKPVQTKQYLRNGWKGSPREVDRATVV